MAPSLAAPLAQVCAFALGCAQIHAARRHAEPVTAVLCLIAVAAALLLLLAASVASAPDADLIDPISIAEAARGAGAAPPYLEGPPAPTASACP